MCLLWDPYTPVGPRFLTFFPSSGVYGFGSNYAKALIPKDRTGNPLTVYMNVSILAFPFIDTVNLKFTADFFLNLRW